jgi:hypothetical protein
LQRIHSAPYLCWERLAWCVESNLWGHSSSGNSFSVSSSVLLVMFFCFLSRIFFAINLLGGLFQVSLLHLAVIINIKLYKCLQFWKYYIVRLQFNEME